MTMQHGNATGQQPWSEPDTFAPPTSFLAGLAGWVVPVLVGTILSLRIIGPITRGTAEHAGQGIVVVLTAFGAAAVAVGIGLRLWEPAKEEDVKLEERKLSFLIELAPSNFEKDFNQRILDRGDDIVAAKRRAARWRSVTAGVEFGGATLLLTAAVFGVIVWDLL